MPTPPPAAFYTPSINLVDPSVTTPEEADASAIKLHVNSRSNLEISKNNQLTKILECRDESSVTASTQLLMDVSEEYFTSVCNYSAKNANDDLFTVFAEMSSATTNNTQTYIFKNGNYTVPVPRTPGQTSLILKYDKNNNLRWFIENFVENFRVEGNVHLHTDLEGGVVVSCMVYGSRIYSSATNYVTIADAGGARHNVHIAPFMQPPTESQQYYHSFGLTVHYDANGIFKYGITCTKLLHLTNHGITAGALFQEGGGVIMALYNVYGLKYTLPNGTTDSMTFTDSHPFDVTQDNVIQAPIIRITSALDFHRVYNLIWIGELGVNYTLAPGIGNTNSGFLTTLTVYKNNVLIYGDSTNSLIRSISSLPNPDNAYNFTTQFILKFSSARNKLDWCTRISAKHSYIMLNIRQHLGSVFTVDDGYISQFPCVEIQSDITLVYDDGTSEICKDAPRQVFRGYEHSNSFCAKFTPSGKLDWKLQWPTYIIPNVHYTSPPVTFVKGDFLLSFAILLSLPTTYDISHIQIFSTKDGSLLQRFEVPFVWDADFDNFQMVTNSFTFSERYLQMEESTLDLITIPGILETPGTITKPHSFMRFIDFKPYHHRELDTRAATIKAQAFTASQSVVTPILRTNEIKTDDQPLHITSANNHPIVFGTSTLDRSIEHVETGPLSLTTTNSVLAPTSHPPGAPINAKELPQSTIWNYKESAIDGDGNLYIYSWHNGIIKNMDGADSTLSGTGTAQIIKFLKDGTVDAVYPIPSNNVNLLMKWIPSIGMVTMITANQKYMMYIDGIFAWELNQIQSDYEIETISLKPDGSFEVIAERYGIQQDTSIPVPNANGTSTVTITLPPGDYFIIMNYDHTGTCRWATKISNATISYPETSYQSPDYTYVGFEPTSQFASIYNSDGTVATTVSRQTTSSRDEPWVVKFNNEGMYQGHYCPATADFWRMRQISHTIIDEKGDIIIHGRGRLLQSAPATFNPGPGGKTVTTVQPPDIELSAIFKVDAMTMSLKWVVYTFGYIRDVYSVAGDIFADMSGYPLYDTNNTPTVVPSNAIAKIDSNGNVVTTFPVPTNMYLYNAWRSPDYPQTNVFFVFYTYTAVPVSHIMPSMYGGSQTLATPNTWNFLMEYYDATGTYTLPSHSIPDGTVKKLINDDTIEHRLVEIKDASNTTASSFTIPAKSTRTLLHTQSKWVSLSQRIDTPDLVDSSVTSAKVSANISLTAPTLTGTVTLSNAVLAAPPLQSITVDAPLNAPLSIFTPSLNISNQTTPVKLHVNASNNFQISKDNGSTTLLEYRDQANITGTHKIVMDTSIETLKGDYVFSCRNEQKDLFFAISKNKDTTATSFTFVDGNSTLSIPKVSNDMFLILKYDKDYNVKWYVPTMLSLPSNLSQITLPFQYNFVAQVYPDPNGGLIVSTRIFVSQSIPLGAIINVMGADGSEYPVPLPQTTLESISITVHYDSIGRVKYAFIVTPLDIGFDTDMMGQVQSVMFHDDGEILLALNRAHTISYIRMGKRYDIVMNDPIPKVSFRRLLNTGFIKVMPDGTLSRVFNFVHDGYSNMGNNHSIAKAPDGGFVITTYIGDGDLIVYGDVASKELYRFPWIQDSKTQYVVKFNSDYTLQWCTRIGQTESWSRYPDFLASVYTLMDGYLVQYPDENVYSPVTIKYDDGTQEIITPLDGVLCVKLNSRGKYVWHLQYPLYDVPYDFLNFANMIHVENNIIMTLTIETATWSSPKEVTLKAHNGLDGSLIKSLQFTTPYVNWVDHFRFVRNSFSFLEMYTDPSTLPSTTITIPSILQDSRSLPEPYNFMRVIDFGVVFERAVNFGPGTRIVSGAIETSISSTSILDSSVTESKIARHAVTANKIAPASITPSKIPDQSLTFSKLDIKELSQVNVHPIEPNLPYVPTSLNDMMRLSESASSNIYVGGFHFKNNTMIGIHVKDVTLENASIQTVDGFSPLSTNTSPVNDLFCVYSVDTNNVVKNSAHFQNPYVTGVENDNISIVPGIDVFNAIKYNVFVTHELPEATPAYSSTISFQGASNSMMNVEYHPNTQSGDKAVIRSIYNNNGSLYGFINTTGSGIRSGKLIMDTGKYAMTHSHYQPAHSNVNMMGSSSATQISLPEEPSLFVQSCIFGTLQDTTQTVQHTTEQSFFVSASSANSASPAASKYNIDFKTVVSSNLCDATIVSPFVFEENSQGNPDVTLKFWIGSNLNIGASNITEPRNPAAPTPSFMGLATIANLTCHMTPSSSITSVDLNWRSYVSSHDLISSGDFADFEVVKDPDSNMRFVHVSSTQPLKVVSSDSTATQIPHPSPGTLFAFLISFSSLGIMQWATSIAPASHDLIHRKLNTFDSSLLAVTTKTYLHLVKKSDGAIHASFPHYDVLYATFQNDSFPPIILAAGKDSTHVPPSPLLPTATRPNGLVYVQATRATPQATHLLVQAPLSTTASIATTQSLLAPTATITTLRTDILQPANPSRPIITVDATLNASTINTSQSIVTPILRTDEIKIDEQPLHITSTNNHPVVFHTNTLDRSIEHVQTGPLSLSTTNSVLEATSHPPGAPVSLLQLPTSGDWNYNGIAIDGAGNVYMHSYQSGVIKNLDGTNSALSGTGTSQIIKFLKNGAADSVYPILGSSLYNNRFVTMKWVPTIGMLTMTAVFGTTMNYNMYIDGTLVWQLSPLPSPFTSYKEISLKPDGTFELVAVVNGIQQDTSISILNANGTSTVSVTLPPGNYVILMSYDHTGTCRWATKIEANVITSAETTYHSSDYTYVAFSSGTISQVVKIYNADGSVAATVSRQTPDNWYEPCIVKYTNNGVYMGHYSPLTADFERMLHLPSTVIDEHGDIVIKGYCRLYPNKAATFNPGPGGKTVTIPPQSSQLWVDLILKIDGETMSLKWAVTSITATFEEENTYCIGDNVYTAVYGGIPYSVNDVNNTPTMIPAATRAILKIESSGTIATSFLVPSNIYLHNAWRSTDEPNNVFFVFYGNSSAVRVMPSMYGGTQTLTTPNIWNFAIEYYDGSGIYSLTSRAVPDGTLKKLINDDGSMNRVVEIKDASNITASSFTIPPKSTRTLLHAQSKWVSLSQRIDTPDLVDSSVTSAKVRANINLTAPTSTNPTLTGSVTLSNAVLTAPALDRITIGAPVAHTSIDTVVNNNISLDTNTTTLAPVEVAGEPIKFYPLSSGSMPSRPGDFNDPAKILRDPDGNTIEYAYGGGDLSNMDGTPSGITTADGDKIIHYNPNGTVSGYTLLDQPIRGLDMVYIPSVGIRTVAYSPTKIVAYNGLTQAWVVDLTAGIGTHFQTDRSLSVKPDGSFVWLCKRQFPSPAALSCQMPNSDQTTNVTVTAPAQGYFYMMALYSATGMCMWAITMDISPNVVNNFTYHSSYNTYITVNLSGTSVFKSYKQDGTVATSLSASSVSANSDMFILKYDKLGQFVRHYQPFQNGYPSTVDYEKSIVDENNNIYTAFRVNRPAGQPAQLVNAVPNTIIQCPAGGASQSTCACLLKIDQSSFKASWGVFLEECTNLQSFYAAKSLFLRTNRYVFNPNPITIVDSVGARYTVPIVNDEFTFVNVDAQRGALQGVTQYPAANASIRNMWSYGYSTYVAITMDVNGGTSVPPFTFTTYYPGLPTTLTVTANTSIIEYRDRKLVRFLLPSANAVEGFQKRLINPEHETAFVDVLSRIDNTTVTSTLAIPKHSAATLLFTESNWHPIDTRMATLGSNLSLEGITTVRSNVLPYADNMVDIGSSSLRFREGHFLRAFVPSDARIKTDLALIADPLEKILSLAGYTYNYTHDPTGPRQAGLVAQDVQRVLPEAVSTPADPDTDTLSINYAALTPLLVEGIKALIHQNQDLMAKYDHLRASLNP